MHPYTVLYTSIQYYTPLYSSIHPYTVYTFKQYYTRLYYIYTKTITLFALDINLELKMWLFISITQPVE